jgi:hypothetical protein
MKPQFSARLILLALSLTTFLAAPRNLSAQADPLAWLDEKLFYESANGLISADLSGQVDLEGYVFEGQPPGLLFERDDFFNPRLSLFADVEIGPSVYVFVQARQDRGFDPGAAVNDFRFDEYFIRYTPQIEQSVSFQFGKSATIFGNWVQRHFSWDNPFINAPLAYENVTIITDHLGPGAPGAFFGRLGVADNKGGWIPVLWGPAYTTGGTIFGGFGKFNYAASIKNNSISSRPKHWDGVNQSWEYPTYTTRVGYTPNAAWDFGSSFSYGAYLLDGAERLPTFPGGKYDRGSYNQITLGADLSYAHHHWEFWSELILARFQVPNVGNADSLSYYCEAKYKFTPKLFAGLRWNQQLFDSVPDGLGGDRHWDRNIWRIDTSLGYRFTRNLQAKLQHSLNQEANNSGQADHLLAGQLTIKF